MSSNQKNSSSLSPEQTDGVFEVAFSLIPAAEAFARRCGLSPDTARDVMTEAAKRIVEAPASDESVAQIRNLPGYLFAIGRNLMLREFKRQKQQVSLDEHTALVFNEALRTDNTTAIENRILLSEIVERMNPKSRTIFKYRTLGYGYGEIAAQFKLLGHKVSKARLRSEYSKDLKRIIAELETEGYYQ
jgi:RNA polymerase sigma factor (sigma-70 family)